MKMHTMCGPSGVQCLSDSVQTTLLAITQLREIIGETSSWQLRVNIDLGHESTFSITRILILSGAWVVQFMYELIIVLPDAWRIASHNSDSQSQNMY